MEILHTNSRWYVNNLSICFTNSFIFTNIYIYIHIDAYTYPHMYLDICTYICIQGHPGFKASPDQRYSTCELDRNENYEKAFELYNPTEINVIRAHRGQTFIGIFIYVYVHL
jgi:hypothetical protein